MEYLTFEPCDALSPLIKCFWSLLVPKEFSRERQQIFSDGCMDLIFNLGDDVFRVFPNGEKKKQPKAFVLGHITEPMWVEPTGEVETFAVRFYPGSFASFTNVDIANLNDKDTPLSDVFTPEEAAELETKIKQSRGIEERNQILEKFLLNHLQIHLNTSALVKSVVDKILHTKGNVDISETVNHISSERRKLERMFSKTVGTSPKQLCKVIRFQQTLQAMIRDNKSLTQVAHDNEFYDQAHFIKDFKQFTGVTPKSFYENKSFTLSSLLYRTN